MPYRPPSHPPETDWARHLDAVMRERGWSRVRLFEEVGAELGYAPKSRSAILPLLERKQPSEAQQAVLRRHFGDPPVGPTTEPIPEPSLADALMALAKELEASRAARDAFEVRLRAVEAELRSLRGRPADGALPEQPAPLG